MVKDYRHSMLHVKKIANRRRKGGTAQIKREVNFSVENRCTIIVNTVRRYKHIL